MRYKLPGLAELAKQRITSIAEDLNILDILSVARDHAFPNLPKTEAWYPSYLESAIKAAVSEDPELCMKPEFVDQIEGDRRFRQVVMGAIVNSYSRGVTALSDRTTGVSTPMTDVRAESVDTSAITEPDRSPAPRNGQKVQEPAKELATQQSVGPQSDKADARAEDQSVDALPVDDKDELKLDAIEPATPANSGPEPYTDEIGFASSKTFQQMGQKDTSPAAGRLSLDTKTAVPMNKRVDSAIQGVEPDIVAPTTQADTTSTLAEPPKTEAANPLVVGDAVEGLGNATSVSSKKSKKKKKKASKE
jgi:hypothetical protein